MGNVASVKLKEDTKALEITEQLVRDFQSHIKFVDHSMAAFARTTESLRKSFATVQQCENRENNSNVNDGASGDELVHTPNYIATLQEIDEALSDQSFVIMDSLRRLLSFIIETGNKCNIVIPDHALLFVERYKSDTFADVLEKDLQYHDVIIESMKKKLESANSRYKKAKVDIDNLNEREKLYQKEKLILSDSVCAHEISAAEREAGLKKIRSEKKELELKNTDMEKEIDVLKRKLERMDHTLSSTNCNLKGITSEKDDHIKQLTQEITELQRNLNDKQCENDSLRTELQNDRQRAKTLQEENSVVQNEYQKLIDESKSLHEEIKRFEGLLEKEKDDHTAKREEMLHSINDTIKEHDEKNKMTFSDEISNVHSKIDEVSETMILLNKCVIKMTDEINSTHSVEVDGLKKSQQTQADKLEKKRTKNNDLKKKCQGQEQTIEKLTNELHDTNNKVFELSSKLSAECQKNVSLLEEKGSKIEALRDEITKMREESEGLKEMHTNDKSELKERAEKEMTLLKQEVDEKNKTLKSLQTHITRITDEKDKLTADSDEKQKTIDTLELKVQLAEKKKIYIQVIHVQEFPAVDTEKELHEKLKLRFLPDNIDLLFLNCSRELLTRKSFPSLIVCLRNVKMKRDHDITSVMKGTKDINKGTALVVFHNRDKSEFRKEALGKGVRGLDKLYGVFDIGYTKNRLHECEENYTSIDQIYEFIKSVSATPRQEFDSAV